MSHSVRSRSTETGRRSGRFRLMLQVGAAASIAVTLAACGGQSSTGSSGSSAATSAASSVVSSTAATSAPATSMPATSMPATSMPASSAQDSAGAGSSSASAGGDSGGAPSLVPAPTGDALTAAIEAKCAAFGESLNGTDYGLSDVKQIADSRGVCRWEATGLSQPAVLQVDPRVANSAQTDQQDRERFCADISEAGAANPESNRAKRIAEQVRSQLYYYAAGENDGLATLSTYREGRSGVDGGISLGCDASYAYETRIYTSAPLTANLSGTSLVAAHRAG